MDGASAIQGDDNGGRNRFSSLVSQLQEPADGGHIALIYNTRRDQLAAILAFMAVGLRENDLCVHITDQTTPDEVRDAFDSVGVDIADSIDRGQYRLLTARETYLESGVYDIERMVELLAEATDDSIESGYDGLRVTGEMTWMRDQDKSTSFQSSLDQDVIETESRFNELAGEQDVVALCQYERDRFSEEVLQGVIKTHSQIIYQNVVCDNPYYIPPERYHAEGANLVEVETLLEAALTNTQIARSLEHRDERLTVVNRILRHNVRNSLNVILGSLDLIPDDEWDGEQSPIDAAKAAGDALVEIINEVSGVDDVLMRPIESQSRIDFTEILTAAAARLRESYGHVSIQRSVTPNLWVMGDSGVAIAVDRVLKTLLDLTDDEAPTLAVRAQVNDAEIDQTVTAWIQITGDIPRIEIDPIMAGEETPIRHAEGASLWIAKWLVDRSDGQLRKIGDDPTKLRMTLPAVTPP